MGSFPALTKAVRRQFLWTESYVGVARRGHPRLSRRPSLAAFRAEQHVLVSALGTGTHALAERALESAVGAGNIVCRVPMFIGAKLFARDQARSPGGCPPPTVSASARA